MAISFHHEYHLDTQKVTTVHELTPKQANTDNQIRVKALERSVKGA